MISVPNRTDDIANAMISATQMIYAMRMNRYYLIFAKQIYHSAKPYIISRSDISFDKLCYNIIEWSELNVQNRKRKH